MAPPSYPELGKLARDLFRRGYHPGIWHVETKSLTSPGIELFSSGYETFDYTKVNGTLQSKYLMEEQGLTLTEGWNTDRWFFGEIMQRDKLAEGLMLALAGRFQPYTNDIDGKFKLGYAQEKFHFLSDVGLNSQPILSASLVFAHEAFLAGLGCDFDIKNVDFEEFKLALGWTNETATLHGEVKSDKSWLASLFYKVSEEFDAAAEIRRAPVFVAVNEGGEVAGAGAGAEVAPEETGGDVTVGLGMIYHLDENALIRAKINSLAELGVGYEQKFGEGIIASISALLDLGHFSDGNHKFGVGLALQC